MGDGSDVPLKHSALLDISLGSINKMKTRYNQTGLVWYGNTTIVHF